MAVFSLMPRPGDARHVVPDEQPVDLYAITPPNIFYHNVGLLELMVTNIGLIGSAGYVGSHGAGWQGGEYLYSAGLWVGALASDDLPYVSTGITGFRELEFRPSLDPIDTIYRSYEGMPDGNRPGFSSQPAAP